MWRRQSTTTSTTLFGEWSTTQRNKQSLQRLYSKSDVDTNKNDSEATTIATKIRRLIRSIFRILMFPLISTLFMTIIRVLKFPLRLLRSTSSSKTTPAVVEDDIVVVEEEKMAARNVEQVAEVFESVLEDTIIVGSVKESVLEDTIIVGSVNDDATLPEKEELHTPLVGLQSQQDEETVVDVDVLPTELAVTEPVNVVTTPTSNARPVGNRWSTAAVDLSGDWVLMVSDEFKNEYDEYLKQLGQPMIVRGVALGIIGLTSEYTEQTEEGRSLFIRGINARGVWERCLVASGADVSNSIFEPIERTVVTADDEQVKAEAWWENEGTVHMSWMRGVTKYGGGNFESKRYLENDGKVLVCESIFHPQDEKREEARVTWKFLRKGVTL